MATITLTQIPRPVSPVAPVQNQTFANDYAIVSAPNLTTKDRNLIRMLGLIATLKNIRGVDYRTNHSQLRSDAAAYTNGISNFDLRAAMAVIEWTNGSQADASLTNDVEGLRKLAPHMLQLSEQEQDRIIAFLEVSINQ